MMSRKDKLELLEFLMAATTWLAYAVWIDAAGIVAFIMRSGHLLDWDWNWVLWLLLIRPILIGGFTMLYLPLDKELHPH